MIPGFKLRLVHVTLNLSLANEYVSDITMSTQVIKYSQNFLRVDQPIRLQY